MLESLFTGVFVVGELSDDFSDRLLRYEFITFEQKFKKREIMKRKQKRAKEREKVN